MSVDDKRSIGLFWTIVIAIIVPYGFLKYSFPYLSARMVGREDPLPMPSSALTMYLILLLIGAYIHITSSDEKTAEFVRPTKSFLMPSHSRAHRIARIVVLALIPLLAGYSAFGKMAPKQEPPTESRIQHPTIPGQYENLVNPFRDPTPEATQTFMEEEGLSDLSMEEAKQALTSRYVEEGRVLYQKNCRPCHGTKADGAGPMARGFRLKPVDFTDTGTIATLVEAYLFWRIKTGGVGLPSQATPWDSAMPKWGDDLTDEQIWKIILAEFDIAGVEPRRPEKLE